jgi:hypothetical protein
VKFASSMTPAPQFGSWRLTLIEALIAFTFQVGREGLTAGQSNDAVEGSNHWAAS